MTPTNNWPLLEEKSKQRGYVKSKKSCLIQDANFRAVIKDEILNTLCDCDTWPQYQATSVDQTHDRD